MRQTVRAAVAVLAWLVALPVHATFHLWTMNELYSNADGSVQFLELTALSGGQEFMQGHTLVASGGGGQRSFTFPGNLPSDSANRRMLIGTQGFAALSIVTPDYVVPNGFFTVSGGQITFAEGFDIWAYPALPSGNLSLNRDGSTAVNSPRNFAGATGTVPASGGGGGGGTVFNVHGLWWQSPAQSGNGWGVNITHQGQVLFATWFTYDLDGSPLWLSSDAHKTGTNTYTGQISQSRSSPFNANPYNSSLFTSSAVGSVTFTFTDGNNGTFNYTVNGVSQSKPIIRYIYSSPVPTCIQGGTQSANVNYEDLWWRSPANSENGWGVNISHQGDVLFVTWFTYGADGTDLWMSMDAAKTGPGVYNGTLYQSRSAPFNAYTPSQFMATAVGTGTITFTDANNGTFAYTVNGLPQSKAITRFVFSSPVTTCFFASTGSMYPTDPYPQ